MRKIVLDRLFASFTELERAIRTARRSFSRKGKIPDHLVSRIETYEEILAKQRRLAQELPELLAAMNWEEVDRRIRLINGLSTLIRDDAREVICDLQPQLSREEREMLLT